jgi:hypothetical protein
MADTHNTETETETEIITPASGASYHGQQVASEGLLSKDDPAKSELKPVTRINAEIEPKCAAIEGTQDKKKEDAADVANSKHKMDDKPYSVFTHNEKRLITMCVGLSQFFSPISGQIYFPSLNAIATDLHVSNSLVNLTITTYLVNNPIKQTFVF